MSTSVDEFTEIVGVIEIPCDWGEQSIHEGEHAARYIATLVKCTCGRTGKRLVCGPCKNKAEYTLDAAECGMCGEVYQPFRVVIDKWEWLK